MMGVLYLGWKRSRRARIASVLVVSDDLWTMNKADLKVLLMSAHCMDDAQAWLS